MIQLKSWKIVISKIVPLKLIHSWLAYLKSQTLVHTQMFDAELLTVVVAVSNSYPLWDLWKLFEKTLKNIFNMAEHIETWPSRPLAPSIRAFVCLFVYNIRKGRVYYGSG